MPEPPISIVIMLIYRSLGAALPPKYHTDRRGVRYQPHLRLIAMLFRTEVPNVGSREP